MENQIIYTVEDIAQMFGVKNTTVREWVSKGRIPGFKLGKRWFFQEEAIISFINGNMQETVAEEGPEHYE